MEPFEGALNHYLPAKAPKIPPASTTAMISQVLEVDCTSSLHVEAQINGLFLILMVNNFESYSE